MLVNGRDCHVARGGASLPLDHTIGGRLMAGSKSLNSSALSKWGRTRYGADSRPADAFATWSPEQPARTWTAISARALGSRSAPEVRA
jgi:hypothetical protein